KRCCRSMNGTLNSVIDVSGVEFPDGLYDVILLLAAQMLVDREADDFATMALGDGEVANFVAEILQRILKMQRDRIVHLGLDAAINAVLEQCIPLAGEEDVEQVDVFCLGAARRHPNLRDSAESG